MVQTFHAPRQIVVQGFRRLIFEQPISQVGFSSAVIVPLVWLEFLLDPGFVVCVFHFLYIFVFRGGVVSPTPKPQPGGAVLLFVWPLPCDLPGLVEPSRGFNLPHVALSPGDEVRMQPCPGRHIWTLVFVVRQHSAAWSYVLDSGNKEYQQSTSLPKRSSHQLAMQQDILMSLGLSYRSRELEKYNRLLFYLSSLVRLPVNPWASPRPGQVKCSSLGKAEW